MATITIRHTHETGTLIEDSTAGDGVWEIAKLHGFRSSRHVGIYVRGSRDQVANRRKINGLAEALRAAGHTVDVAIDDTPRDRAIVLADQAARLEDRQQALDSKAARGRAEADRLREASDALTRGYAMGQPLLVDHYSYPREKRRVQKAQDYAFRGLDTSKAAAQVQNRADAVGVDAAYAATPQAIALRIPRLEAELRDIGRRLDEYDAQRAGLPPLTTVEESDYEQQLRARDALLRGQLDHDRMVIAKAIEAGTWTPWGPDTVQVGDLVNQYSVGGDWLLVMRVNKTTVSVDHGRSWTDTMSYAKIRRHSRLAPAAAAAAVAAAKVRQAEQKAAVAGWPAR